MSVQSGPLIHAVDWSKDETLCGLSVESLDDTNVLRGAGNHPLDPDYPPVPICLSCWPGHERDEEKRKTTQNEQMVRRVTRLDYQPSETTLATHPGDASERRKAAAEHIRTCLAEGALGYAAPAPFIDALASFVGAWTLYLPHDEQVARAVEIGRMWK
jgi:hypothetical protein